MSAPATTLRFVVLRHEGVEPAHFDLMFETAPDSLLTTWRSDRWPIDRPTTLTKIGDHRRAYLDYEGPLSNGRGHVKRIAAGRCTIERREGDQFWTVRFDDAGEIVTKLHMKSAGGADWLVIPACG